MASAIEGEVLEREAVMSSIRNRPGLNQEPEPVRSRMADGAGELVVAVRNSFGDGWREGCDPMQVAPGRIDKPTVHFEAPPSDTVPGEMTRCIEWFNRTAPRDRGKTEHYD